MCIGPQDTHEIVRTGEAAGPGVHAQAVRGAVRDAEMVSSGRGAASPERVFSKLMPMIEPTFKVLGDDSPVCQICREALEQGKSEKLGEGQFGRVYVVDKKITVLEDTAEVEGRKLVRRSMTHSCLAVKLLHDDLDEVHVADFRREMAVMRSLNHPNVVSLIAVSLEKRPLMLVSEFADSNLEAVLQRTVMLPFWRRLELSYDLARGLEYLHRRNVIHRDLKPANVLIVGVDSHAVDDESRSRAWESLPSDTCLCTRRQCQDAIVNYLGHVKICDFGLAIPTAVESPESEGKLATPTGNTGSYRFMAPEVHKNLHYGRQADIFSFGMIFYWMVEGQPPFNSKTGEEAAKLNSCNTRPSFKIGNVKKERYVSECIALTRKCWAASPSSRPSASEICDDLEVIMRMCPRPQSAVVAAKKALSKFSQGDSPPKKTGWMKSLFS